VAIVTGHIAHYRIRRSAGRLTGRGLSLAGLILGYGSLLLTAGFFGLGAYWSGEFGNDPVADVPRQPGDLALLEVERQIVSDDEGYALGNSNEARERALVFADRMKELDESFFTQTDATLKLSGGKYVTWCELRDGRCAFVVHVPEYRRFDDEAKDVLAQLAWMTAQETAAESLEPGEELAVGLKGVLLYGAVMIGRYDPDYDGEDIRVRDDRELLFPYFVAEARAPADPGEGAAASPQDAHNPHASDEAADLPLEPGSTEGIPASDTMPPDHPDSVAGPPENSPADGSDGTPSVGPAESRPDSDSPANTSRRKINPESVEEALAMLQEDDSFLRTQAVYYFRDHPPSATDPREDVVDALFAQFEVEGDAAPNRFFVATALQPWVTNDDLERLEALLDDENVLVRTHAVETIGLLGTKEAAEALARRLQDPERRSSVSYPLRQMGAVAEEPLLEQLRELQNDPQALREICNILGEVGGRASVRPLQRLTQSDDATVRSFAESSLERIRQRLRSAN
jgi:hypothetical protein